MSVRLKNRYQSPINGFQFFQAETGWDLAKASPHSVWSFDSAVAAIVEHRKGNPRFGLSTDPTQVANELDFANAVRMKSIAGADYLIIEDAAPMAPTPKLQALRSKGPAVAGGGVLPKLVSGAASIIEWLGEGASPVPAEQAEARARICAAPCKWNDQGDWTRYFTQPISEGIRKQLGARQDLGLATILDPKLNICEICSCPLKLKVHVPIQNIKLKPAVIEDLKANAPWCWILKELPA